MNWYDEMSDEEIEQLKSTARGHNASFNRCFLGV
jgi:hypothetical protein